MGRFVNPDNTVFRETLNSEIYVDKSSLINYTNHVLGKSRGFICNSRPRRFGKSMAANMLSAYYSKGADSKEMFSSLEIASSPDWEKHLNKYDVIHFDVQGFIGLAGKIDKVVSHINKEVIEELREYYPEYVKEGEKSLANALSMINVRTGNQFVVIIDEWDVFVRDYADNQRLQDDYFRFLCSLFKGELPSRFIALAYMTGILPVKKQISQSGLNNFYMYSFIDPGSFREYMGFTEEEVVSLCNKYNIDAEEVKRRYGSYLLDGLKVYNPMEICDVMMWGEFNSFWCSTCSSAVITDLMNEDFKELKMCFLLLLGGGEVRVDVDTFDNAPVDFGFADDILTYMIHLGYLGYNEKKRTVFIPNEEIKEEMRYAFDGCNWKETVNFTKAILDATLSGDGKKVASEIEKIHNEYASLFKNNERDSLLRIAYSATMDLYSEPIHKLEIGKGFVNLVYIPRPKYARTYPSLVVELKWDKIALSAIEEIKAKNYPESIKEYTDNILLVGINYDKETKRHECRIEKL